MVIGLSNSAVAIVLSTVAVTYVFLWMLLRFTQNGKEPPALLTTFPFVSPILGMVQQSKDFYAHMRQTYRNVPIFTLRLPGTRIYAINSVDLIPVVQRQWRTLIFAPIQVKAAQAAMGASKEAVAIMEQDLVTEHGFINGMVKVTHPTMSNGADLDALNAKAFEIFDKSLQEFVSDARSEKRTINMYEWLGKQIMRATTDAVYGSANPMRDAENLRAWHDYHPALMYIMLDILPQNIFFKAAVKGRKALTNSFAKYYASGSHKQGSAYIQAFTEHCIAHNIPEKDIPCMLLGTVFNNVANTIPSAFWVVYRIFSDSEIREQCRNEVRRSVQHSVDGKTATIDLSYVLNSCPVLLSTYHEIFRYHGMANSVRVVREDHMLENSYLLKKGGLVIMSARSQHSNPEIWGEDVDRFNYMRFLKGQQQRAGGTKQRAAAFRGFGGGVTLCPGRHFATSEILLLTTLLLLRFDLQPVVEGQKRGVWGPVPTTDKSSQAEAMEQPDEDVKVELVPRAEVEGKKWKIVFSGRRDAELLVQN